MKSRTKTIISGNYLEVEIFPVTAHGHRHDRKRKLSREAQKNLNDKNAAKKLERLINNNFVPGDILITLGYNKDLRPNSYEQTLKDVQKYIRRVKNYRKKKSLPEIKYIYVIECSGANNWHVHLIMSQIPRDEAESLWTHADFVNSKAFQPTVQEGGAAFANYIAGNKGKKSKPVRDWRRWNCSKNLKQPKERTNDNTHTRREIARIARERIDDKEYWQRKYKGYNFISAVPVFNEFNGWWYLYVKMYKIKPYTAPGCPVNNRGGEL